MLATISLVVLHKLYLYCGPKLFVEFLAYLSCSAFMFAKTIVVFYDFIFPVFQSPEESKTHLLNTSYTKINK